jgi:TrmH family RNA methyltransferase
VRERAARDAEGLFVCEGPRVIRAALERGAEIVECFAAADASGEIATVLREVDAAGVPILTIDAAGAERIGDTKTPQPLFAVVRFTRVSLPGLAGADLVLVASDLNDPGNAGTLLRSAAAAGAEVVVLGSGSVDAYNPKVVRASAGACFAVRIVEGMPAMEILDALGTQAVQRLGAIASGGAAPESCNMRAPTALVLGHETRGLPADLPLDGFVTIPMHNGESLNVAMAGTALLFEAARQRRAA